MALFLSTGTAEALAPADFDEGNTASAVDGYPGMSGGGWTSAWGTMAATSTTVSASATSADPLAETSDDYVEASVNATTGSRVGQLCRKFDGTGNSGGVAVAQPVRYTFYFRPVTAPGTASTGIGYYMFSQAGGLSAGTGPSDTWIISTAHGSTCYWQFTDGNKAGGGTAVVSPVPIIAGDTYCFSVNVNPANQSYTVSVIDLATNASYISPPLGFRSNVTSEGTNLAFGATLGTGTSATFDLDSLLIQSFYATSFVWGMAGHAMVPTAANYTAIPLDDQLDLVQGLNCSYYRMGGASLTNMIPLAASRRVTPLPLISLSQSYYLNTTNSLSTVYTAAYNVGLNFASTHKGHLPYVEMGNEVDDVCIVSSSVSGSSPSDYDDSLPNQKYSRCMNYLKGMSDGVAAGDPGMQRILSPCTWVHYGFTDRLIADGVHFDALAWHWYTGTVSGDMGSIGRIMKKLSTYQTSSGTPYPLWITETDRVNGSYLNGSDAAMQEQADMVKINSHEFQGFPQVKAVFVYEMLDETSLTNAATNPEAHYGLYQMGVNASGARVLGAEKPAAQSYRDIIDTLGTSLSSGSDTIVNACYRPPAIQTTGTWAMNNLLPGYDFFGYLTDNGTNKGGTVKFYPCILSSGTYTISIHYPATSNASTATPVTVSCSSGTTTTTVNQSSGGGSWVSLPSTYNFPAGNTGTAGYVQIGNTGTTGTVLIDAVKFHKN